MSEEKSTSKDNDNVLRGSPQISDSNSQIPVPDTNDRIASTSNPSGPETDLDKDTPLDQTTDSDLDLDGTVEPEASRPEIDLNEDPPLDPDLDLNLDGLVISQATSHCGASQQNRPGDTPHNDTCNSSLVFTEEFLWQAITRNYDEHRRCNCRTLNCINLNCPCFSTAMYCGWLCKCRRCLNRSRYENIVDLARDHFEAQNPLAFAPKDFRKSLTSPIVVEKWSARDSKTCKRRCSCKKDNKCTQQYCECLKAKVGCSSECKCDGCQNIYGAKEVTDQLVKTEPKNDKEPPDCSSSKQ